MALMPDGGRTISVRLLFLKKEAARRNVSAALSLTGRDARRKLREATLAYHEAEDALAAAVRVGVVDAPEERACGPQPGAARTMPRASMAREYQLAMAQRRREIAAAYSQALVCYVITDKHPKADVELAASITREALKLHRYLPPFEDDRYSRNTEQGRSREDQ